MRGGNRGSHFLLASFLPSISIKLSHGSDIANDIGKFYYYHTNPIGLHSFICKECGMPFINKKRNNLSPFFLKI